MSFSPNPLSFSAAVDCAERALDGSLRISSAVTSGVGGGSNVEDMTFGLDTDPDAGCLNIPKLSDFLSGLMLQEIV